jgi:undecaprenyl-diphosphatase
LCFFFLGTAALLLVTELLLKRRAQKVAGDASPPAKDLGWKGAALMGGMQAAAIFPGFSRSGFTVSGGLLYGAERDKTARFSFLMSLVVIAGGALLELISVVKAGGAGLAGAGAGEVLCGMAAAAVAGYFALRWMLKLIGRLNFKWFSAYLFVLSVVAFVNYFMAHWWGNMV